MTDQERDAAAVMAEVGAILSVSRGALTTDPRVEMIMGISRLVQDQGRGPDDPVRSVTAKMGDKWCKLIIMMLRSGSYRPSLLRRLVSTIARVEISRQVLSTKLRELEVDGLISRTVIASNPPQVTYGLTRLGEQFAEHLDALLRWISDVSPQILAAREAQGAAGEPDPS